MAAIARMSERARLVPARLVRGTQWAAFRRLLRCSPPPLFWLYPQQADRMTLSNGSSLAATTTTTDDNNGICYTLLDMANVQAI